ncbi:MAG: hypothetical protein VKQ33_08270 [Candidatus Sericytochromatia bacterium]|nr:hypothetical protein [Candidatus Sericytochromatia bacterium]
MVFTRVCALPLAALTLTTSALAAPARQPVARPKSPCSGAGLGVTPAVRLRAPLAVARTHGAILAAARDCDYDRLERLGREGRPGFTFTFGTERSAAAFWRREEAAGHRFLGRLIRILRLDFGRDGQTYIWPAVFARSATAEDWNALLPIFGRRQIVTWRDHEGYTGLRVGIAADGDWLYAIEGD